MLQEKFAIGYLPLFLLGTVLAAGCKPRTYSDTGTSSLGASELEGITKLNFKTLNDFRLKAFEDGQCVRLNYVDPSEKGPFEEKYGALWLTKDPVNLSDNRSSRGGGGTSEVLTPTFIPPEASFGCTNVFGFKEQFWRIPDTSNYKLKETDTKITFSTATRTGDFIIMHAVQKAAGEPVTNPEVLYKTAGTNSSHCGDADFPTMNASRTPDGRLMVFYMVTEGIRGALGCTLHAVKQGSGSNTKGAWQKDRKIADFDKQVKLARVTEGGPFYDATNFYWGVSPSDGSSVFAVHTLFSNEPQRFTKILRKRADMVFQSTYQKQYLESVSKELRYSTDAKQNSIYNEAKSDDTWIVSRFLSLAGINPNDLEITHAKISLTGEEGKWQSTGLTYIDQSVYNKYPSIYRSLLELDPGHNWDQRF